MRGTSVLQQAPVLRLKGPRSVAFDVVVVVVVVAGVVVVFVFFLFLLLFVLVSCFFLLHLFFVLVLCYCHCFLFVFLFLFFLFLFLLLLLPFTSVFSFATWIDKVSVMNKALCVHRTFSGMQSTFDTDWLFSFKLVPSNYSTYPLCWSCLLALSTIDNDITTLSQVILVSLVRFQARFLLIQSILILCSR